MRSVSSANLQGMRDEIDSYDEIRDNISNLTFMLKDMNTLTLEMHEGSDFAMLISSLKQRLGEEGGSEKPAAKKASKTAAPKKSEAAKPSAQASSASGYLEKVVKKLVRDDYQELEDERFGDLRFDKALEKNNKYLFNTLDEFHRFVVLEESDLSEDRYLELEKEIKQYAKRLGEKNNAYVHVVFVIVTDSVADSIKELIYDTKPAKYAFAEMGSSVIVVYAAAENDIIFPKVITDNGESKYGEKIQDYLNP